MAAPVLYPNAMDNTTMTRPIIRAFIPAPGGALPSSPRARTAMPRMAVAVDSVKNAVPASIHEYP
jgi:hypothetical protein